MISPYHKIKKNAGVIRDLAGIVRGLSGIIRKADILNVLNLMRAAALANLRAGPGWLKGDGSACGFRDPIASSPNRSPVRADKWTVDDTLVVAGLTLTTINFTIDLKGETGRLIVFSDSGTQYLMVYQLGSTSEQLNAGFGNCTYIIDGVSFSGTRGELYGLLSVAGPHDVEISTAVNQALYFGGTSYGGQAIAGQEVTNLVVNGVEYFQPTATAFAQGTLSKQPLAFPVTAGEEYAAFPRLAGNYLSVPDASDLDGFDDFTIQAENIRLTDWTPVAEMTLLSKYASAGNQRSWLFWIERTGELKIWLSSNGITTGSGHESTIATGLSNNATASLRVTRTGSDIEFFVDSGSGYSKLGDTVSASSATLYNSNNALEFGSYNNGAAAMFGGSSGRARIWNNATQTGDPVLDINIPTDAGHLANSFTASSGQTVTVNQSGQDPALIVRHPGIVSDTSSHLLSTLTTGQNGCWVIAVFHVLGDGGDSGGRIVSLNKTGSLDWNTDASWLAGYRDGTTSTIKSLYNTSALTTHTGAFSGNVIYEAFAGDTFFSRVNGGTAEPATVDISAMDLEEINIFSRTASDVNTTLFLQEVLILPKTFPAATVAAAMPLLAAELGYVHVLKDPLVEMRNAALAILDAGPGWLKGDGSACGFRDPIASSPNRGIASSSFAQGTLSKQPLAFPVTAGEEYAAFPGVSGNYLSVPDAADLDGFDEFTMQIDDVTLLDWTPAANGTLISKWLVSGDEKSFILNIEKDGKIRFVASSDGAAIGSVKSSAAIGGAANSKINIRVTRNGSDYNFFVDTGSGFTALGDADVSGPSGTLYNSSTPLEVGTADVGSSDRLIGSIGRARIWNNATQTGTPVLDIDISRDAGHLATSFTATSGQTVTVNQSGQDPCLVLRHPGIMSDDASHLLSTLTTGQNGCWVIAVFHVLGDGGDTGSRIVSLNKTGDGDAGSTGWIPALQNAETGDLMSWYRNLATTHSGAYSGSLVYEAFAGSTYFTRVNGGTPETATVDISAMDLDEINIFDRASGGRTATLFLQAVYVLPKTFSAAVVAAAMPLLAAELGHTYE